MTLSKLNIVRDCWWANASGTNYMMDETGQLSTQSHGLYKSLNANDSQYIRFCGSGTNSATYYTRLDSTSLVPEAVWVTVRASGIAEGSWLNLTINDMAIGSIGNFTNLFSLNGYFNLTADQKERILNGRISDNYDYIGLQLTNSGLLTDTRLYNIDVYYSGNITWNNYTAGLPNVLSVITLPNELKFRNSSQWVNQLGAVVGGSGYYHINKLVTAPGVDNTYIRHLTPPDLATAWYESDAMPNGGLSLIFDIDTPGVLDPLTQVTRAMLTLRMSLPPSGQYENARDTFEVNGYNYRFKDQDYKEDMPEAVGSFLPNPNKYGYFLYGAGYIVEQSGFANYNVELDFLDPGLPSGDLASITYRNIDIFNNMEFKLVGIPSGALISSAQLYFEYLPNEDLPLYTIGGVGLKRRYVSSYPDIGGSRNPLFGDGAWQHRGTLNEGEIFDAFYNFSEQSGLYTYPVSLNPASGCYGQYINAIYEYEIYEGGELTGLYHDIIPVEPQRRNYYRNPVRTEFGTTYDPIYYRDMIYNGSPFIPYNVHDPNANAYSPNIAQVYFDDRLQFGTDFTLYFMLYRELTNDGQTFAQFFHRGSIGSAGWEYYEMMGLLQTEDIIFLLRDVNDNVHRVEVDIPEATNQPILIWVTCKYDLATDTTRLTLDVHVDIKNFFTEDWLHDEKTFPFPRKQYGSAPKTMLGPLYTPRDLDQQLAFTAFFSYVSICEFAWADSEIPLSYETSDVTTRTDYDLSSDPDKRFFSSRICNAEYLQGRGADGSTIGGDPLPTSGWMSPTIAYGGFSPGTNPQAWWMPEGIKTQYDGSAAIHYTLWGEAWRGMPSDWLIGRDFNFNIPSGNVITGIQVEYYCQGTLNAVKVNTVQLLYYHDVWSFDSLGTNQVISGPAFFPSNYRYIAYGGPDNQWGNTFSGPYAEYWRQTINSENFCVGLKVSSFNYMQGTAFVDHLRVKVFTSGVTTGSISEYKALGWLVPNGSGAAQWSTQYAIDDWSWDEYELYNPVTTAGTHNLVHPYTIYATLQYEHSTNHPSGADVICDIEFDTGSIDNWKVFRAEASIPSGTLNSKTLTFSKHIGMHSLPIVYTDINQICVNLTTKYADLGTQKYYGDLKITSLKVYFDSSAASTTGVGQLYLYTKGAEKSSAEDLDLFVEGHKTSNDDLYLFTKGTAIPSSGQIPLYTLGSVSVNNDDLTLYIYGIPYYASGQIPLYIKANAFVSTTLYIEGLTPGSSVANLNLFTYGSPTGTGLLYTSMPLMTKCDTWGMSIPLYLYNNTIAQTSNFVTMYLKAAPLPTGMMTLYTAGPSGCNNALYLYTRGLGTTDGAVPFNNRTTLYMARDSESIMSTLPLYIGKFGTPDFYLSMYGHGDSSSFIPMNADKTLINATRDADNGISNGSNTVLTQYLFTNVPSGHGGQSLQLMPNNFYKADTISPIGSGGRTICGWFKPDTTYKPTTQRIFGTYTAFADAGIFYVSVNKTNISAYARLTDSVVLQVSGTVDVWDNQWHHFAAVLNRGSTFDFYVDGIKSPFAQNISPSSTLYVDKFATQHFSVGLGTSVQGGSGLIYDVRLYTESLDDADILNVKNGSLMLQKPYISFLPNLGISPTLYISGSGAPPNANLKLYTHGY